MTSTIRRHDAVPLFFRQLRSGARALSCRQVAARMASYPIEARGARTRPLSTDVALIGDAKAERLLIMTSATHGAEGFCGSSWPCWTMRRCWRARSGVACCWCTRSICMAFRGLRAPTRGNVDLNRNAQPFDGRPCPRTRLRCAASAAAAESWPPKPTSASSATSPSMAWPPTPRPSRAGSAWRPVLWRRSPGASLKEHAAAFPIGWIDVHTGPPRGHGEKIYAAGDEWRGRGTGTARTSPCLTRAAGLGGHHGPTGQRHLRCLPDVHADADGAGIRHPALADVVQALRGRNWLRAHPEASGATARGHLDSIAATPIGTAWCWDRAGWRCCRRCAACKATERPHRIRKGAAPATAGRAFSLPLVVYAMLYHLIFVRNDITSIGIEMQERKRDRGASPAAPARPGRLRPLAWALLAASGATAQASGDAAATLAPVTVSANPLGWI